MPCTSSFLPFTGRTWLLPGGIRRTVGVARTRLYVASGIRGGPRRCRSLASLPPPLLPRTATEDGPRADGGLGQRGAGRPAVLRARRDGTLVATYRRRGSGGAPSPPDPRRPTCAVLVGNWQRTSLWARARDKLSSSLGMRCDARGPHTVVRTDPHVPCASLKRKGANTDPVALFGDAHTLGTERTSCQLRDRHRCLRDAFGRTGFSSPVVCRGCAARVPLERGSLPLNL